MQVLRLGALALAGILLSACGGGGSGSGSRVMDRQPIETPPPMTSLSIEETGGRTGSPIASLLGNLSEVNNNAPIFGSVLYSLDTGTSRPTGLETTFALDRLTLDIPRTNGTTTTLDTDRDIVADVTNVLPQGNPVTNLPAGSVTVYNADERTFTASTMLVEWENDDVTNYLAIGHWVHLDLAAPGVEIGAFIDGPEFDNAVTPPVMGTATYRGIATGAYLSTHGTDTQTPTGTFEQGEYDGRVQLTADFGTMSISGRLDQVGLSEVLRIPSGGGATLENNYFPGRVATDYQVVFQPTPIMSDGTFEGLRQDAVFLSETLNIAESEGDWAGRFSTVNDAAGNPRAVAGAHRVFFQTTGNTQALMTGAFYGATERFE